jgi:beta-phosphoglucomutase-like phosphatase (HAD superfamily)
MKHLIFDMDGTIVDSMPIHRSTWVEFAQKHSLLDQPEELDKATSGRTGVEGMRALFGSHLSLEQAQAYVHEKEALYRTQFAPKFQWVGGFEKFAQTVRSQGYRCGLGTAGDRHNVKFVLDRLAPLGLDGFFETAVGGDEGLPGKPDPAIFLEVARRMGVAPADCLVFEDSPAGIAAAGRAGMRAVALLTSYAPAELAGDHVVAMVADFHALMATAPQLWGHP